MFHNNLIGMDSITEVVNQYDMREVISAGVGIGVGFIHATYDVFKRNEQDSSKGAGTGVAIFTTSTNSLDDGLLRSAGNGIIGGVMYHISYNVTYKTLTSRIIEKPLENR